MKDKSALETHPLPSTEDTKLGSILNDLTDEVQDVRDSILHISQKYRTDLTNQLEQSYKFEQHLVRNFKKINKKSKRIHQKSESLNTSLNKKLDQLKNYDELDELSSDITDSIYGILDSLTKIEMILPYNERLSVRDSPHRAHYPNLYKLLNPNDDEDGDTIRDQDELSSFERLEIQEGQEEDYNEADESSNGEGVDEEEEENQENQEASDDDEDQGMEMQSVVHSEDVRSDTVRPELEVNRSSQDDDGEKKVEGEEEVVLDDGVAENVEQAVWKGKGNDKMEGNKKATMVQDLIGIRDGSPEARKVSENTRQEEVIETKTTEDDLAKEQELESVIDNYKSSKEQQRRQSQSLRSSLRPIRSTLSIPSPSSAGVNATTGLSTNLHDFAQSINTSLPTQAHGTIVSGSLSQGSSLAENLKKFISSSSSGSVSP